LLGDALHSITPFRAIGPNTALRDAALLGDLSRVNRGPSLLAAVAAYEREVIDYGFAAASLAKSTRR
jgi:salicylate hydroxylase